MRIEVILSSGYRKRALKFLKRHPHIVAQYKKTLLTLSKDPYHPSLRMHRLKGNKSVFHSISINIKYRILLTFIMEKNQITLVDIGTHDELYR